MLVQPLGISDLHLLDPSGYLVTRFVAGRPIPLDEMLRKTDEVRGQFARLVGAEPDEIGFLFATSEGENIVASDVAPLLAYTRNIIYLEDGEYVIANEKKVDVVSAKTAQ